MVILANEWSILNRLKCGDAPGIGLAFSYKCVCCARVKAVAVIRLIYAVASYIVLLASFRGKYFDVF